MVCAIREDGSKRPFENNGHLGYINMTKNAQAVFEEYKEDWEHLTKWYVVSDLDHCLCSCLWTADKTGLKTLYLYGMSLCQCLKTANAFCSALKLNTGFIITQACVNTVVLQIGKLIPDNIGYHGDVLNEKAFIVNY